MNFDLVLLLFKQVIIMLILVGVGALCYKIKLISKEGNASLTNLVLYVVNPLVIVVSYQQDFSYHLLKGLGIAFALSIAGFGAFGIFAHLFIRGDSSDSVAERLNSTYSNCGFMGIPLALALFGSEGVFYVTAVNTAFNIIVWTFGIFSVTKDKSYMSIKKIVTNPTIIATVVGFLLFLCRIELPSIIYTPCDYISSTVTPLAMIVAGVTIAQNNILKAFLKPRIYLVCALKLLIVPLILAFLFAFIPDINNTSVTTALMCLSCPSATIATMLSVKFNKSASYSAQMFGITTILSVISLPVVIGAYTFLNSIF
ncbi:MAG: AEC family transporter [Ruminococcus sp.]|nr:AEC family transporter [Ruminococcus sp.]